MTLFLLDVSRWQAGLDLTKVKAAGFSAVNVQLTGKDGYLHLGARAAVEQARSLGMGVCVYHWLDGSGAGASQAELAWHRIADVGGPELLAHQVDCEDTANPATWPIWRDYVNAMQDRLGRHVVNYSGDWWWRPRGWTGADLTPHPWSAPNAGYPGTYPGDTSPLWAAGYGGWESLAVMQYAVTPVAGIKCSLSAVRDPAVWAELTGAAMAWIIARNLDRLRTNVKSVSRYRNMTIYGIGDEAHRLRTSSHNPDDTAGSRAEYSDADSTAEVRALDFMVGSTPAADMEALRRALTDDPRSRARLSYVIYGRHIWRRRNGFVREVFDGTPHDDHIHASGYAGDDENGSDWPAVLALGDDLVTDQAEFNQLMDGYVERLSGLNSTSDSQARLRRNWIALVGVSDVKTVLASLGAAVGQVDEETVAGLRAQLDAMSTRVVEAVRAALPADVLDRSEVVEAVEAGVRNAFAGGLAPDTDG